jgi:hypothetical protein
MVCRFSPSAALRVLLPTKSEICWGLGEMPTEIHLRHEEQVFHAVVGPNGSPLSYRHLRRDHSAGFRACTRDARNQYGRDGCHFPAHVPAVKAS